MVDTAQKDYLTGFYLRQSFDAYIKDLFLDSKLKKNPFTILLLDLDRFKKYNDKYGHPFGDEVIKYVSSSLRLTLQKRPCRIFRYGGDEFLAVLPEVGVKNALALVQQFKYNMRHRPFLIQNKLFKITVSCGIAGFPTDGDSIDLLVKKSDQALYFSKRHGRNKTILASRIKFINMRYMLILFGSLFIVVAILFLSYKYAWKAQVQRLFSAVKSVRVTTTAAPPVVRTARPKDIDKIMLKNGKVIEGKILKETDSTVSIGIYMDGGGSASMSVKRSEIDKIVHYSDEKTQ